MSESAFIALLNMSITASAAALAVMLVRLALAKAPKVFSYALWAVVFFRLLCPLTFQSGLSLLPVRPHAVPQEIGQMSAPLVFTGVPPVDSAVNAAIQAVLPSAEESRSVNPMQIALFAGRIAWAAGFAAMLLYAALTRRALGRRVREATLVEAGVFESDRVVSPFVLGVLRPRIYLPAGIGAEQRAYVLAHERAHVRRGDHLLKPLAFLALALHWFNPAVWLSFRLMCRDMELSCDEAVLRRFPGDARQGYSAALLAMAVRRSGLPSPLSFGESDVKSRVRNALRFRRPALWLAAAALTLVCAATLALAGNRAPAAPFPAPLSQAYAAYDLDALYARRMSGVYPVAGASGANDGLLALVRLLPPPAEELSAALPELAAGGESGTGNAPYTLQLTYEFRGLPEDVRALRQRIEAPGSAYQNNCRKHALILMSLVGDLKEVTVTTRFISPLDSTWRTTDNVIVTRDSLVAYGEPAALWSGGREGLASALRAIDEGSPAVGAPQTLGLEDIRRLAAKGLELSMAEFGRFAGYDPLSGHYGKLMTTKEGYQLLLIGNDPAGRLITARFTKYDRGLNSDSLCMDIRYDNLEAYMAEDVAGNFVDKCLEIITSGPSASSNPSSYLAAYPEQRDAVLAMDYAALPRLTAVLNSGGHDLREAVCALLADEVLQRRIFSSYATQEARFAEEAAKLAYERYAGRAWTVRSGGRPAQEQPVQSAVDVFSTASPEGSVRLQFPPVVGRPGAVSGMRLIDAANGDLIAAYSYPLEGPLSLLWKEDGAMVAVGFAEEGMSRIVLLITKQGQPNTGKEIMLPSMEALLSPQAAAAADLLVRPVEWQTGDHLLLCAQWTDERGVRHEDGFVWDYRRGSVTAQTP